MQISEFGKEKLKSFHSSVGPRPGIRNPQSFRFFSHRQQCFLLILAPFTLALLYIGLYGRVLRASLIEAMQEDYIRTARAKGLSETRILLRHALRTSLVSVVTMFGLDFGALVGGGALLLKDTLPARFQGKAIVPDEPILSIARGLYKLNLSNLRQKKA